MLTVLTQNSGFRRSAGCIRSELRTGLWRPTLEDEIGKPLADLGLLAKPTRLAIVPWLLVFFHSGARKASSPVETEWLPRDPPCGPGRVLAPSQC
jgi:hypothetical protein